MHSRRGWSTSTAPLDIGTKSSVRRRLRRQTRRPARWRTGPRRRTRRRRRSTRRRTTRCAPTLKPRECRRNACSLPPIVWQDAEACIPLPSLSYFGLDASTEVVADAPSEERASCLFVKRIADTRRRASSCFAKIAHPHPPPPPDRISKSQTAANAQRLKRWRLDDLEQYDEPRRTDRAQWAVDTAGALAGTEALIDGLGEDNPVLKSLLTNALGEIRQANSGRRLLQRNDYEILMTDALVDHDIMNFYGKDGIPGVTVGSCEARIRNIKSSQ